MPLSSLAHIPVQYHQSANFGDALAPYIAQKLSGKPARYVLQNYNQPHYVICGSILSGSNQHSIIWGAGNSQFNEPVPKNKKIIMVRGKLTRETVLSFGYDCPECYGDTGLLLSAIYKPKVKKRYVLGLCPHWVDMEHCKKMYAGNKDVLIIDLLKDTETVIKKICSCEIIASSSLHALIAAHSYSIPAVWVEFSDKVYGRGFKFWDYFSSVNIPFHQALNLRSKQKISKIISKARHIPYVSGKIFDMLESCPFLDKDTPLWI